MEGLGRLAEQVVEEDLNAVKLTFEVHSQYCDLVKSYLFDEMISLDLFEPIKTFVHRLRDLIQDNIYLGVTSPNSDAEFLAVRKYNENPNTFRRIGLDFPSQLNDGRNRIAGSAREYSR